ncbi:MAG: hypothetical protein ACKPHU_04020, partial [Planctomycetaceae bacterium]
RDGGDGDGNLLPVAGCLGSNPAWTFQPEPTRESTSGLRLDCAVSRDNRTLCSAFGNARVVWSVG